MPEKRPRRRYTIDSLFSDTRPQATGVTDLANAKEIRLDRIEADPDQPRRSFDQDRLDELAASIRLEGVLQPIVVRYDEARDTYIIIHGERRFRAAGLVGLEAVPALVRDVPAERRLVQQLMENVVRDDLNAVDRAAALRALRSQLGDAPWEAVAEAVGIKRSRLFQLLGTEKLPSSARDDIQRGAMSEKQSRLLQNLPPAYQEALRSEMVDRGLSARIAPALARALRSRGIDEKRSSAAVEADIAELRRLLDPDDLADLQGQTHTVLTSITQDEADDIASVLGVPKFDEKRIARELAALARSLTRTDHHQLEMSAATRTNLSQLRDALVVILRKS